MSLRSAVAKLQARSIRPNCLPLTAKPQVSHHSHAHNGVCLRSVSSGSGLPATGDSGSDNGQRGSSSNRSSSGSSSSETSSSGSPGLFQRWQQDSRRMQEQLKALGAAGVIAYGLFNTLYYSVAFVFVWFTVANVPSGLGFSAAARKAAEVFALVWAGSQVTKILRAGAALACAPLIDQGLDRLGLHDKRRAYLFIVLGCVALASVVMLTVIGSHA